MLAFRRRSCLFARFTSFRLLVVGCAVGATAGWAEEPTRVPAKKAPTLKAAAKKDWKIEIIPGPAIGPSPVPKAELASKQPAEDVAKTDVARKPDAGELKTDRKSVV